MRNQFESDRSTHPEDLTNSVLVSVYPDRLLPTEQIKKRLTNGLCVVFVSLTTIDNDGIQGVGGNGSSYLAKKSYERIKQISEGRVEFVQAGELVRETLRRKAVAMKKLSSDQPIVDSDLREIRAQVNPTREEARSFEREIDRQILLRLDNIFSHHHNTLPIVVLDSKAAGVVAANQATEHSPLFLLIGVTANDEHAVRHMALRSFQKSENDSSITMEKFLEEFKGQDLEDVLSVVRKGRHDRAVDESKAYKDAHGDYYQDPEGQVHFSIINSFGQKPAEVQIEELFNVIFTHIPQLELFISNQSGRT